MRTVDHDGADNSLACDNGLGACHMFGLIIGSTAAAPQYDVAIRIPHGLDDGGEPVGVDSQKMMRLLCGDHGIPGYLKIAFCTVLEADRHGKSAGHFPVRLAFSGAASDRDPAPEISDVLGRNRVQGFSRAGDPALVDVEE